MAKKKAAAKSNVEKPSPQFAFRGLAHELAGLLQWAIAPWPTSLPDDWLTGQKRAVHHAARTARNATTDKSVANKIITANRQGVESAELLQQHPTISMVAVEHWTVLRYRQMFDDVSALQRYFRQIADELDGADGGSSRKPRPSKNTALVDFAIPLVEQDIEYKIIAARFVDANPSAVATANSVRMALKRAEEKANS
ncbi:MAG: hypothetical protein SH850_30975 [Planctomycetaceae bacterium]|nr:hypothetical protein [Planctomycetaceae bacterium]